MRKTRKLKGPEFRLLLSATLCAILFFGSSTVIREKDVCAAIDTGYLEFYNDSKEDVIFNYSGPNEKGMGQRVNASSYLVKHLESGLYSYTIMVETFDEKTKVTDLKPKKSGSFNISINRTNRLYYSGK